MQVAGRLTVLWAVVEAYPSSASASASASAPGSTSASGGGVPFYALMVLAWSAADVVRYVYFAARLLGGHQYGRLVWLRYSAFYVLYPVGIASEVGVVARAVAAAWAAGDAGWAYGYLAAATLYVPGEFVVDSFLFLCGPGPRSCLLSLAGAERCVCSRLGFYCERDVRLTFCSHDSGPYVVQPHEEAEAEGVGFWAEVGQ